MTLKALFWNSPKKSHKHSSPSLGSSNEPEPCGQKPNESFFVLCLNGNLHQTDFLEAFEGFGKTSEVLNPRACEDDVSRRLLVLFQNYCAKKGLPTFVFGKAHLNPGIPGENAL